MGPEPDSNIFLTILILLLFTFLNAWKEYLFALTLCNKKEMWVISVALT